MVNPVLLKNDLRVGRSCQIEALQYRHQIHSFHQGDPRLSCVRILSRLFLVL